MHDCYPVDAFEEYGGAELLMERRSGLDSLASLTSFRLRGRLCISWITSMFILIRKSDIEI